MYRNPPARMVRSAVLLFGDVCGMIVGVECVGVFWNGHEDRFTNPTEPPRIEEHPARMEGQCDFVYRFQDCGRTTS